MSDAPNTADLLHTVLTVSHGNINVGTMAGMTIVGGASGSSSVTLSGTAAQITAALASEQNYTGNPNYYGPDSLSVTTTDTVNNATSAPKTVGIKVADTTTVSETVPTYAGRQREHRALAERANAISVSDGPNTGDLLHTMLTVSHGNINVGTMDGMTIVGGASGSSSVTLSGTAAQITAALASAELHRQPQLLRPRQPVGDHDRHSQQRHFGNEDGGDPGRRYDDGVGCGACLRWPSTRTRRSR